MPMVAGVVTHGIPYQDALGRYADFHSLHKTLCTNLAKVGVPRRISAPAPM